MLCIWSLQEVAQGLHQRVIIAPVLQQVPHHSQRLHSSVCLCSQHISVLSLWAGFPQTTTVYPAWSTHAGATELVREVVHMATCSGR